MSIVSSTAVVQHEPQDLAILSKSKFKHINKKRLRRTRYTNAFNNVTLKYPFKPIVFLVYANGKCVILGSRSDADLNEANAWLRIELASRVTSLPHVSNYVYAYETKFYGEKSTVLQKLFTRLRVMFPHRTFGSFDPELSPALIYNPESCKTAKAMIFSSGKVTITGLKTKQDIVRVREELDYIVFGKDRVIVSVPLHLPTDPTTTTSHQDVQNGTDQRTESLLYADTHQRSPNDVCAVRNGSDPRSNRTDDSNGTQQLERLSCTPET